MAFYPYSLISGIQIRKRENSNFSLDNLTRICIFDVRGLYWMFGGKRVRLTIAHSVDTIDRIVIAFSTIQQ